MRRFGTNVPEAAKKDEKRTFKQHRVGSEKAERTSQVRNRIEIYFLPSEQTTCREIHTRDCVYVNKLIIFRGYNQ